MRFVAITTLMLALCVLAPTAAYAQPTVDTFWNFFETQDIQFVVPQGPATTAAAFQLELYATSQQSTHSVHIANQQNADLNKPSTYILTSANNELVAHAEQLCNFSLKETTTFAGYCDDSAFVVYGETPSHLFSVIDKITEQKLKTEHFEESKPRFVTDNETQDNVTVAEKFVSWISAIV